ncbi:MAG: hypothetical protein OT477_06965 [Chloroflexi bacterium]|nr:hypothetical protein [Chloroflexota bacterium]
MKRKQIWRGIGLCLLLVGVLLAVRGQTAAYSAAGSGPGGVGATDGTDTLEVWLRSDRGVYSDTGCTTAAVAAVAVACWTDQSGNGRNGTQATAAAQPVYQTAVVNGQPAVRFGDGVVAGNDNDQLLVDFNFLWNGTSNQNYTIIGVADRTIAKLTNYFIGTNANANNRGLHFGYRTDTQFTLAQWGNDLNTNAVPNAANMQFAIATGIYNNAVGHSIRLNHNQYFGTNANLTGLTGATAQGRVGAGGNNAAHFFDGDVVEVIMYTKAINDAERILIENYLSSKYAVALSSNDKYDGDTVGNGEFDWDVAGIGQEATGNNSTAASMGMIVANGSFLQDNGDYLMFGHNTAVNGRTAADAPTTGDWATAPAPNRWTRHWYIDVTDINSNGGTVDITFDYSAAGMTDTPVGPASNYRLLGRAGTSGEFSDIATATSIAGDQVIFAGVDTTLLGSNFTLGTLDVTNSPLAVTMQQTAVATSATAWLWLVAIFALILLTAGRLRRA